MIKVVIADDNYSVRKLLGEILKAKSKNIGELFVVKNGQEAIDIVETNAIDLIITDIRMPVVGGLELCESLRKISKSIVIVLISAYAEFEYAREALRYGVTDYILKPFGTKQLEQLINIVDTVSNKKLLITNFINFIEKYDLKEVSREALITGEVRLFFDIMDEMEECSDEYLYLIKEYAFSIVSGLYDYIEKCGFNNIEVSKKRTTEILLKTKTVSELCGVIRNTFCDLNQFSGNDIQNKLTHTVKEYIDNNYSDAELNVNILADKFDVSRGYLSVSFSRCFDISISNYLKKVRMDRAVFLLENTNYTIAQISTDVGYINTRTFSRTFLKTFKKTPTEYRNGKKE